MGFDIALPGEGLAACSEVKAADNADKAAGTSSSGGNDGGGTSSSSSSSSTCRAGAARAGGTTSSSCIAVAACCIKEADAPAPAGHVLHQPPRGGAAQGRRS